MCGCKYSTGRVRPLVPVVNQIRTYWWCSPPRTGRQRMRPARSTVRETGASFSKDKCVRTLVVIVHVRQQHVTEVALTEHNNVVKAFPSDRNRSAVRHIRFAKGSVARSAGRECPLIEVYG